MYCIHWVNTFYEYRSISFLAEQGLEKLAAMILLSAGITSFAIKLRVYHSTETEFPLRELTLRTLRSTCVDG